MKKVAILSYDGCWGMGVFAATDFFRIVALLEQYLGLAQTYAVEVLSSDGAEVRAASSHLIRPDAAITETGGHDLPSQTHVLQFLQGNQQLTRGLGGMQVYTGFALHQFNDRIPCEPDLSGHQKGA